MLNPNLPPRPAAAPVAIANNWTTPRRMQAALVAICAGAALLFLFVLSSVNQMRGAIDTVGTDAAPSIIAAQHIRAYLAGMDSNLANELICKPGQNNGAVTAFEDRRKDVIAYIVEAAKNITYGDSEKIPIVNIAQGLAQYEELVARARDYHERGDAAWLTTYREATALLHKMLTEAVQLDKVNDDELEKAYAVKRTVSYLLLGLVGISGLALLAALVVTQMFLTRRMNRIINPGLAGATALSGLFLVIAVVSLLGAGADLKTAKKDAFDSIRALWQARAVAFDANGDESRWLLDRANASHSEQTFYELSNRVLALKPGENPDPISAAKEQSKGTGDVPYLAAEIGNITFTGEGEAAEAAITDYASYFRIDGDIRKLENEGKHDEAVALCIGAAPGQSNYVFKQFDTAKETTIGINKHYFLLSISKGQNAVKTIGILNPLVALVTVVLAFVGMRPRLREYAE